MSIGIRSEGQISDRNESKSDETYTLTVAKTIGSNDTVALLGKVADLMAPSVPHIGESVDKEQWLAVGVTFLDIVWLLLGGKEKEREQKEREGRNKNRSCSVHSVHLSPCLSLRLHEEDGVDVKVHCCRV